jgi:ParB family chromosome partitioning protein
MPDKTNIIEIEVTKLVPFANHPFKLYQGKRSEALVNSVRESGVLTPIIVRPQGKQYEILSGHNRVEAAKKVGLPRVPAIIREGLSDDDARLIVTITNLIQRSYSDLSHSERAAALSEHYNAIKSQGRRTDILNSISALLGEDETCVTVRHKLKARDVISKIYGISGTVVAQYLRVAQITNALQARLDNGEFSLRAAVELSYLSEGTQTRLDEALTSSKRRLDVKAARELREAEEQNQTELNESEIERIIGMNKGSDSSVRSVKVEKDLLAQYFDDDKSDGEISSTIAKALEAWFANGNT